MKMFASAAGDLITRADVGYAAGTHVFKAVYAEPHYPLVTLRDLTLSAQYGSSTRADAQPNDPRALPMLRMVNLQEDAINFSPMKWVELGSVEQERYRLDVGDLLFNRTNSKELVGKCAVYEGPGTHVFASYIVRVVLDRERVRPHFVAAFLSTTAGRVQIDRVSRQIIGMANINAEEILDLVVPLPPLAVQDALLRPVLKAKQEAAALRDAARVLWEESGNYLEGLLAVGDSDAQLPLCYPVPVTELTSDLRLDAKAYQSVLAREEDVEAVPLGDIAEINPRERVRPDPDANGEVPFIGLPDCDETRVRDVGRKAINVVGSAPRARPGDILFARIEPSIFNKKYVLADGELPPLFYTSTEFYVVRADPGQVDSGYLWSVLFADLVFAQIAGQTTGSSGRRRLPADSLKNVRIPLPDLDAQRQVGKTMLARRAEIRRSNELAEKMWSEAKVALQDELLGRAS